jgi:hypothetical protein
MVPSRDLPLRNEYVDSKGAVRYLISTLAGAHARTARHPIRIPSEPHARNATTVFLTRKPPTTENFFTCARDLSDGLPLSYEFPLVYAIFA